MMAMHACMPLQDSNQATDAAYFVAHLPSCINACLPACCGLMSIIAATGCWQGVVYTSAQLYQCLSAVMLQP